MSKPLTSWISLLKVIPHKNLKITPLIVSYYQQARAKKKKSNPYAKLKKEMNKTWNAAMRTWID